MLLRLTSVITLTFLPSVVATVSGDDFTELAKQYVREYPELYPVSATLLGDHRFDSLVDDVSAESREQAVALYKRFRERAEKLRRGPLSRPHQVDAALLDHALRYRQWRIEVLEEWAWNPLVYTRLAGNAVYGLMARDFAPLKKRLHAATERLLQFPRLFRQVRATLVPKRVPRIHAETAVRQNRGILNTLKDLVEPERDKLPAGAARKLDAALKVARAAIHEHQVWLEKELLPNAMGKFRLGRELYDEKLRFTLHTPLTRRQIRVRADRELARVREQMWTISRSYYKSKYPYTEFPQAPSGQYKQAIIRACLELAYADRPAPGQIVATAKKSLAECTAFVRENDLVTIPPDPVEIIIMPEFRRGVSLAYCDSPGPLDVGQKTFYAVAPLPKKWTQTQIDSFLREYNRRSIHDLTVHEAMPGHFLQLAHSNRYPSTLRAVLSSGVFIEGWAVYAEQMMVDAGFQNNDPLMKLIALKWYLRGIANAIIDQAIHVDGMSEDEAMTLMIEQTFQEEREAAGKWVRAQLTSAQLSTYFVGYQEHVDLRQEVEKAWGDEFTLKKYHDQVLSFGSPPVQFVRALLLQKEIPR